LRFFAPLRLCVKVFPFIIEGIIMYIHQPRLQFRFMLWMLFGALILAVNPEVAHAASSLQETGGDSVNIWLLILPIATAALIVERMIEVVWNLIEWLVLNFRSLQPAGLKSPQYVQFKSGISLLLGVVIGILAANFMGLHLLDYLRPLMPGLLDDVPASWDVLIAGLIVGAMTKPVHETLGILTQFKNFLGGAAIRQREAAGAELAEGVLKLSESEAQGMLDVPGIGPAPIDGSMNGEDDETEAAPLAKQEEYADMLHNRTVM